LEGFAPSGERELAGPWSTLIRCQTWIPPKGVRRGSGRRISGQTAWVRRLLAAVLAGVALLAGCSGGSTRPATSPRPSSRSASAPTGTAGKIPSVRKVLPQIEHFVEQERGLRFKHPVKAKLLGRKAFVARLNNGQHPPKRKAVERLIGSVSAVGLISARANIVKAFRKTYNAATLGFYDDKTKRLYVRGTRATPGVRAVLSHELTHALTDQWFGLRRPQFKHDHQELSLGFTALTEGDAERTRKAYEAKVLTPAQRQLAEQEENGGKTPKVPQVVLEIVGFPYAIGPQFVDAVVEHGGISALNAAYRRPPTSSEQLIDPAAYFSHDEPKHVATPPADGPRIDHGDLGVLGLILMLENGLPRSTAQLALGGWGGDQYVTWRAGDHRWCLRDSIVMDYGLATNAIDSALRQWVPTRHGAAHLEHTGTTTTFVSCSS
jgi:hypothetical protein